MAPPIAAPQLTDRIDTIGKRGSTADWGGGGVGASSRKDDINLSECFFKYTQIKGKITLFHLGAAKAGRNHLNHLFILLVLVLQNKYE